MTAWGNLPPALPPHGTVLAWVHGCRCEECEGEYQRLVSELATRRPLRLPAEPEPRKLNADTRARLEPAVRQSECPVCGAPRHQRCRNLAFPQHFTPTHPERQAARDQRASGRQSLPNAARSRAVSRLVCGAGDGEDFGAVHRAHDLPAVGLNAGAQQEPVEIDALVALRIALVDADDGRREPFDVGLGGQGRPGQRVALGEGLDPLADGPGVAVQADHDPVIFRRGWALRRRPLAGDI
jgi:hypothetical protein